MIEIIKELPDSVVGILATGRVTCDGEPVTIDVPKSSNLAAVPWLPYDEKLLEMICYTAIEIAHRNKTSVST